jgi:hypothetical protein
VSATKREIEEVLLSPGFRHASASLAYVRNPFSLD